MSVAIIDYHMGNLASLVHALNYIGLENHIITSSPKDFSKADKFIMPGVGSFRSAMKNLHELNLVDPIKEEISKGSPFLGICVGMQIMYEFGDENGGSEGLGVFKGNVEKFEHSELKIPHVGFNNLETSPNSKLFKNVVEDPDFYFVHSYRVGNPNNEEVSAYCNYGEKFVASAEKNNIFATQFHPELSQTNGLTLLDNFLKIQC